MEKLEALKQSLADGTFHHATYRDRGSIWEGLYIYLKSDLGRGFSPEICFGKNDPELHTAEDMVRHTGVSLGAYGCG